MRELVVENQEVLLIPQDYKFANRGKVTAVRAGDFTLELEYEPENIMVNTYCEFYTQTPHGKLYFDSYAKEINGKTLIIASPAKHKFLQRRQYTRIKFLNNLQLHLDGNLNIDGSYAVSVPLSDSLSVDCEFQPIRIEKRMEEGGYTVSGQFVYKSSHDKMILTQFCAKRSVEIKNK